MCQGGGPRGSPVLSGGAPEAPRLELIEQDSKDSAQSSSTSSSLEVQPEYNVRYDEPSRSKGPFSLWGPERGGDGMLQKRKSRNRK